MMKTTNGNPQINWLGDNASWLASQPAKGETEARTGKSTLNFNFTFIPGFQVVVVDYVNYHISLPQQHQDQKSPLFHT